MGDMEEEIADLRYEIQNQKNEIFLYDKNIAILGDFC